MIVFTRKDVRGNWRAESSVELIAPYVLTIHTYKNYSKQLVTYASVHRREPEGFLTHLPFSDFSKCVESSTPRAVNKKACEIQHAKAVARLDEIKAAAMAHHKLTTPELVP